MLFVENHQRVEAVEVEHRQGLCTTSHHDICLASLQHLSPKNQGIGSRGTSGRNSGALAETAEMVGYLTGVVATTVIVETRQMGIRGAQVCEMTLCDVHTSYRRARDQDKLLWNVECGGWNENTRILQCLADSQHTHKSCTTDLQ